MSPAVAVSLLVALVVLSTIAGAVLRRRDGRRRSGGDVRFDPSHGHPGVLGARATLVQFSTEMCARCPQVRRMLSGYAEDGDGVRLVEVDLTRRPDLSTHYRVLQTPTTLVVDGAGTVRARFHGVPQRQALAEALASL
jgi:hypothetical protein